MGTSTSNTVQFSNAITGLVTIANVEVGGELTVSGNTTVTGNVTAGYFVGDGSNITGIASNLDQIANNGNVTSNTVQFSNAITSLTAASNVVVTGNVTAGYFVGDGTGITGIASNLDPIVNNGNVTSNTVQFSNAITSLTAASNIIVTGNVTAGYFVGDGTGITGIASNLDQIVNNGNVTSNTVQFSNAITSLTAASNIVVTGNVTAGYFVGDGSNISGIASNLDQIVNNGNVTSNTVQFSNAITSLTAASNIVVTGNVTAGYFVGDGTGITGIASNLDQIVNNGNVTSNTVQFSNAITSLTAASNIVVTGNVTAGYFVGDGTGITGIASNLDQIVNNGNVTSNTVQFSNAITGLVTTANVEVGGELTVSGNVTAGYFVGDGSNVNIGEMTAGDRSLRGL